MKITTKTTKSRQVAITTDNTIERSRRVR